MVVRVFGILGVIGLIVVSKKVCLSLIKYPILPVYGEAESEAVLVLCRGGMATVFSKACVLGYFPAECL